MTPTPERGLAWLWHQLHHDSWQDSRGSEHTQHTIATPTSLQAKTVLRDAGEMTTAWVTRPSSRSFGAIVNNVAAQVYSVGAAVHCASGKAHEYTWLRGVVPFAKRDVLAAVISLIWAAACPTLLGKAARLTSLTLDKSRFTNVP
tara:strand:+ start:46450 stop:46884 length:435 start_codon:yes stop_codon:yes gene_type:complete